ncbi:MAG: RNA-guided endonuclease TnpB family protein [Lactimicrobium sp.]|jgi:putative transposase|uniref:RNA-guided endonuclease TnpB family protein n=1 Tax=Lactimicrobium sp. TaxID=2563780 RepID=UPI002F35586F
MQKGYKYRIYPNEEQIVMLSKTFGCARFVYNYYLDLQAENYASGKKHLSKIDCNNDCNRTLKEENPWLREVDKFAITNAIYHLDNAYQKLFHHTGGKPKHKKKHKGYDSYTTNSPTVQIVRGCIKLPKLGKVIARLHRQIPANGKIKSATVSRMPSGKYYCSLLVETPDAQPKPKSYVYSARVLGLDYCSPDFYVDNFNCSPASQHWYRRMQKKLKREQKKQSRMYEAAKASGRKLSECQNFHKQKRKVAKIQEKIARQRNNFTNQLSAAIAKQYDAVVVEDIDLRGMAGSLNLGKATNDNGFGMFRQQLAYKLADRGKYLIKADRFFPSSKTCSCCGAVHKITKDLSVREWRCPTCGAHHLRDQNAAQNLKNEGIRILRTQGVAVL